ncbi:MotE family protein [Devosia sp.]|uniref:MotE family protein n=1 Tax=Devosia sp. TaxID=1871048 RepID=UPI003A8FE31D
MTAVRLLPVVVAAATALLLLKTVGIVTHGGYVLGPSAAVAQDDAGAPTMELTPEPTMEDESPLIEDAAPTLPMPEPGDAVDTDAGQSDGECVPGIAEAGEGQGDPTCDPATLAAVDPDTPVNLADAADAPEADSTEATLLKRLGERREELDAREAEIDIRMSLLDAAEKRIEQRTQALESLEARINALVDQKKAEEQEQFLAVVSMYETMKPKEAAAIFDKLEMDVMLRVAAAMNPRKMAPVLARMNPDRAKDLTAALAEDPGEPSLAVGSEDLAGLPAIVGQ